jgi:hypothetical protein
MPRQIGEIVSILLLPFLTAASQLDSISFRNRSGLVAVAK